LCHYSTRETKW